MMEARRCFPAMLQRLWHDTDGQDLVEYSLLLGFLALAAVAILNGVKGSVTEIYSKIASVLSSATASS